MIEHKRKTESLVNRLRKPIHRIDDIGTPNIADLTDKMNAIGEALAYLVDKKHAKQNQISEALAYLDKKHAKQKRRD
jgi:hypothetical protein